MTHPLEEHVHQLREQAGLGPIIPNHIMDFTEPRKQIRFRIDADVFECIPDLPVLTLIDFAETADRISTATVDTNLRDMFVQMFQMVLTDESAARFVARMSSRDRPISLVQTNKIMPWLMEQYGMRPTVPSVSSSDGSLTLGSGLSSTGSAPPPESTSGDSPPTGS